MDLILYTKLNIVSIFHTIYAFFFLFAVITTGFTDPGNSLHYRMVTAPTITKTIDRYYDIEKEHFIEQLNGILYVCVTSDIWSTLHTSYMGITIHWIDNNLKLVSKLLCCRHFTSPHTAVRITSILHDIFAEYGISNKVNFPLLIENDMRNWTHFESVCLCFFLLSLQDYRLRDG